MTDYSNSVIYEICCKDSNITDTFIGSTNSFETEEYNHKHGVYKQSTRLYKFINSNGGWNNFHMLIIEKFPCETEKELESREQFYITRLKPKLNPFLRLKPKKEIICTCGQTIKRSSQHYHLKSMKHRKSLLSIQSPQTEWNLYKEHMNNENRLS